MRVSRRRAALRTSWVALCPACSYRPQRLEFAAETEEKAAQLQDLLCNSAAALPSVAEAVLSKAELMQFFADRGVVRHPVPQVKQSNLDSTLYLLQISSSLASSFAEAAERPRNRTLLVRNVTATFQNGPAVRTRRKAMNEARRESPQRHQSRKTRRLLQATP